MSLNSVQDTQHAYNKQANSASSQSTYDLVCVGFGTAALSLAAALADRDPNAKVLFIERESKFEWKPAQLLPENSVRTSFLRDLITTRNPRSEYTFVNYLHTTNQLIKFTNSSHINPTRLVMGNYLTWVAERIAKLGWVQYGAEAVRVNPSKKGNQVAQWTVDIRNPKGSVQSVSSKRVVLATGNKQKLPSALSSPRFANHVLHSSDAGPLLENLKSQDIAIVGQDQEAAEIFEALQAAGAIHTVRATLFIPDSALRPEDNTSFIQDVIDDRSATPTQLPPEVRARMLATEAPTTNPRISLQTIESLYEMQYAQRISEPDSSKWRFQIRPLSEIVGAESESNRLRLVTKNPRTGEIKTSERAFDVVIAGTGVESFVDAGLVAQAKPLFDAGALTVDREYRVNFRNGVLAPGCALWVLGSLEERKIRDDTISFAAERGERTALSVVKAIEADNKTETRAGELSML